MIIIEISMWRKRLELYLFSSKFDDDRTKSNFQHFRWRLSFASHRHRIACGSAHLIDLLSLRSPPDTRHHSFERCICV